MEQLAVKEVTPGRQTLSGTVRQQKEYTVLNNYVPQRPTIGKWNLKKLRYFSEKLN